ncbi:MAG: hypothetical protein WAM30_12020 [Candidatus Dormiibacterota bacterium]
MSTERSTQAKPVLVRLPGGWGLFLTVSPTAHPGLAAAYRTARERGTTAVSASGSWRVDGGGRAATLTLAFSRPRPFDLSLRFSTNDPETQQALRTIGGLTGSHVAVLFPARADHARAMRAVDRGDMAAFLHSGITVDALDGTPLRPLVT